MGKKITVKSFLKKVPSGARTKRIPSPSPKSSESAKSISADTTPASLSETSAQVSSDTATAGDYPSSTAAKTSGKPSEIAKPAEYIPNVDFHCQNGLDSREAKRVIHLVTIMLNVYTAIRSG